VIAAVASFVALPLASYLSGRSGQAAEVLTVIWGGMLVESVLFSLIFRPWRKKAQRHANRCHGPHKEALE